MDWQRDCVVFENRVSDVDCDDPLENWAAYVRWSAENVRKGLPSSHLLNVLERCTSSLSDDDRYRNDPRLLKIWNTLAEATRDPLSVYSRMQSLQIGQKAALFYESWAVCLLNLGRLAEAKDVISKGLEHHAQPVTRLKKKFDEIAAKLSAMEFSMPPTNVKAQLQVFEDVKPIMSVASATKMPETNRANPSQKPAVEERRGYAFNQVYIRDEEFSFEENRGKAWYFRQAELRSSSLKSSSSGYTLGRDAQATILSTDTKPAVSSPHVQQLNSSSRHSDPDDDTKSLTVSSPTIHTKAAMSDILEMFNRPLPFEQANVSTLKQVAVAPVSQHAKDTLAPPPAKLQKPHFTVFADDDDDGKSLGSREPLRLPEPEQENRAPTVAPETPKPVNPPKAKFVVFEDPEDSAVPAEDIDEQQLLLQEPEVCQVHVKHSSEVGTPGRGILKRQESQPSPAVSIVACPLDGVLVQSFLMEHNVVLGNFAGYFEFKGIFLKAKEKMERLAQKEVASGTGNFRLGKRTFCVLRRLSEGSSASVFVVADVSPADVPCDRSSAFFALKVQRPPCPWEFYIGRQLSHRLPTAIAKRSTSSFFGCVDSVYIFEDESCLLTQYGDQGTLNDVIYAFRGQKAEMNESLVIFYVVEMLRTIEVLHQAAGIIHGDLKPSNFLVRAEDAEAVIDWQPNYDPTGQHGWAARGLTLIDFASSFDCRVFPLGTKLSMTPGSSRLADVLTKQMGLSSWTYEIDYLGIAATAYAMLHPQHDFEVVPHSDCRSGRPIFSPKLSVKPSFQSGLWQMLFDVLLNPPQLPLGENLQQVRGKFEQALMASSTKNKPLKSLLMHQDVLLFESRST